MILSIVIISSPVLFAADNDPKKLLEELSKNLLDMAKKLDDERWKEYAEKLLNEDIFNAFVRESTRQLEAQNFDVLETISYGEYKKIFSQIQDSEDYSKLIANIIHIENSQTQEERTPLMNLFSMFGIDRPLDKDDCNLICALTEKLSIMLYIDFQNLRIFGCLLFASHLQKAQSRST